MYNYKQLALSYMEPFSSSGMVTTERAMLIGRSPYVAPQAVTHAIFRGLTQEEIAPQ